VGRDVGANRKGIRGWCGALFVGSKYMSLLVVCRRSMGVCV
jgi:hypothetical protein